MSDIRVVSKSHDTRFRDVVREKDLRPKKGAMRPRLSAISVQTVDEHDAINISY